MKKWNVRLVGQEDPAFEDAFKLAQQNYKYFYGADLLKKPVNYLIYEEFTEGTKSLNTTGHIKACMSCTGATQTQRLFSETYLKNPVEDYITSKPERERIMEIGSLASIGDPYSTKQLIRASTVLTFLQYKWEYSLITITPVVENLLQTCQISYYQIGLAKIDMLPEEEQTNWGHYYEFLPKVCVIDVKASLANHLNSLMEYPNLLITVDGSRP